MSNALSTTPPAPGHDPDLDALRDAALNAAHAPAHEIPPLPCAPRVLSIAGTDPTGGAGQAADLKSIAAMGGYGMTVITAVVAQNTTGVRQIHTPPLPVLRAQLEAVSDDVQIDAVKIGMLGSVPVIEEVRRWLDRVRVPVTVLDPVMVATTGARLLDSHAEAALRELLPLADLITPNLPELAVLAGRETASTWDEALAQGHDVARIHGVRVLVKGGHLPGDRTPDALIDPTHHEPLAVFDDPRVPTANTHGTGCSLSSAIATTVARTGDWTASVRASRAWLRAALRHADRLEVGHGNGPVDHFHHVQHIAGDPHYHERFTETLWREITPLREQIDQLEFVRGLGDGSLDPDSFSWYLEQDLHYLEDYSRALALLAARAPNAADREFFADGAAAVLREEAALHRGRSADHEPEGPGPVTAGYTRFLLAATAAEPFAVGAAAVLPCYWLYAQLAATLTRRAGETGLAGHPYADWLATYDDPQFQLAADRARTVVDRAARDADAATRARMREAFVAASQWELKFFAEPLRRATAAPFADAS